MPFGFSTGFQQAVQSIATTVGQLAGQAVSVLNLVTTGGLVGTNAGTTGLGTRAANNSSLWLAVTPSITNYAVSSDTSGNTVLNGASLSLAVNNTIVGSVSGTAFGLAALKITTTVGDSTGTPGNATLNTASGRCSMNNAAGATLVITNNLVSTSTIPFVNIMTADGTMTAVKSAVPTANTLTITFNAASTGTVNIGWWIIN